MWDHLGQGDPLKSGHKSAWLFVSAGLHHAVATVW